MHPPPRPGASVDHPGMSRIALTLIAATALVAVLAPAAFAGPRISRTERA